MPLNLFYTMVQKSQKWPKTQIKVGPALNFNFITRKCIFRNQLGLPTWNNQWGILLSKRGSAH